ncbi:MAG: FAD-dependent oxidoreductase [Lachnospiraceae bacterium]|nr:FAD-dependent oxidoreductase [Lachnospiraceae bacterium]
MRDKKKVIIIGAGPSGLTAGWELLKDAGSPYEVTLLEMSDAVGGMARTITHNGDIMDVGGHRFFSKEKAVLEWWKAVFERKKATEDLLLRQREVSIYYGSQFFDYPVTLNYKNLKKLGFVKAVQIGLSYMKCRICPRKEKSLEDFYVNRFGKKLYTLFFEKYTEKLCGVHPKWISPEWGRERVRGLSVGKMIEKYLHGKGGQSSDTLLSPSLFYYPKCGPGQLWENVAEEISENGGLLRLNCQVIEWKQREDGSIKSVLVKNGTKVEEVDGDIFISTMPLSTLVKGMKQAPKNIKMMAEKLPYRSFVTMGLWVNHLRIQLPDCWIYIQDEDVKVCRIQFYKNWSPYLMQNTGNDFIAMEYFCEEGDGFWSLSEEECMQVAVQEAIKLGILDKKVQVLDWHRERIAKAYPGYHDGYEGLEEIRGYVSDIENLFCIGRNGLHQYWNMDKCMISAWDAVEQMKRM